MADTKVGLIEEEEERFQWVESVRGYQYIICHGQKSKTPKD